MTTMKQNQTSPQCTPYSVARMDRLTDHGNSYSRTREKFKRFKKIITC